VEEFHELGQMVFVAPERWRADDVDVFLNGAEAIISGVWRKAGVNDFHAGVAQGAAIIFCARSWHPGRALQSAL